MRFTDYLPHEVNTGSWLTAYTLERLQQLDAGIEVVLPICSLGTPYEQIGKLGEFVLPPLFHEALDPELKQKIVAQIQSCFPYHELLRPHRAAGPRLRVLECSATAPPPGPPNSSVLAFSVDTAVEEHGPHLPLSTDTIQSYGVLELLAEEYDDVELGPPVEYGQLTWGLPFGFSVDLTAPLLTRYVTGFVNAVLDTRQPSALYVVDVHGSIIHRQAIVAGLQNSRATCWRFRWLHEPLVEFASQRGDQHAGGVETAIVEKLNPRLVDRHWWPARCDEIAAHQMSFERAVELSADLQQFVTFVATHSLNGVVGDIRNYDRLNAGLLLDRMLAVGRRDIEALLRGESKDSQQNAGQDAW